MPLILSGQVSYWRANTKKNAAYITYKTNYKEHLSYHFHCHVQMVTCRMLIHKQLWP